MNQFSLQPYSHRSRYTCPACNHRGKTYKRYINTETGQPLADHVGRCDREDKCGYHFTPVQYFKDTEQPGPANSKYSPFGVAYAAITPKKQQRATVVKVSPQAIIKADDEPHYINPDVVNASFTAYACNNFVNYLISKYGFDAADKAVGRYRIGTSDHWPGATVFWQLDTEGYVRTGKIMLYDVDTGKRVKQPFNHITWMHVLLMRKEEEKVHALLTIDHGQKSQAFNLVQCLFGAHLLKEHPDKHVAIVESEKTAIIAGMHDEGRIWLAAGCLGNLNPAICEPLKGRTVTLYPDLGAYAKWKVKARSLQLALPGSVFTVSDLLEQIASDDDRKEGLDLGDGL